MLWYRYLNRPGEESLMDAIGREDLKKCVIVRCEKMGYTAFETPEELYEHIRVQRDPPSLHEVTPGYCSQRLKIDVDLPDDYLRKHGNSIRAILDNRSCDPLSCDAGSCDPSSCNADLDDFVGELIGEATSAPVSAPGRLAERLVEYVIETYVDEFFDVYDAFIDPSEILVATSSGQTGAQTGGQTGGLSNTHSARVPSSKGYKHSYHVVFSGHAFADSVEANEFGRRARRPAAARHRRGDRRWRQ